MTEQEKFEIYITQRILMSTGLVENTKSPISYADRIIQGNWETWQEATAQSVPEGCVVVPVEPTHAMHKAFYEGKAMTYSMSDKAEFYDDYSAMIKAAQES